MHAQVLREEAGVLRALRARVAAVRDESTSSLEDDVAMLASLRGSEKASATWLQVALEYRIERKRLAAAADTILDLYGKIIANDLQT
jgi:hypothetical protein